VSEDKIEVMAASVENSDSISGKRRGRPENLRPWPKGVSGNPAATSFLSVEEFSVISVVACITGR